MKAFSIKSLATLSFTSIILILAFQNCSEFKVVDGMQKNSSFEGNTLKEMNPIPASDKIDDSCMSNNEFDACLFLKNPVAQANSNFTSPLNFATDLSAVQTFGVKLRGTIDGKLESSNVVIEMSKGTPLDVSTASIKLNATGDSDLNVAQVNAYYWSNRVINFMKAWTGELPKDVDTTQIKIVVDDTITGYSPDRDTIHLRVTPEGNVMAYNGGVIVHFMGHALADIATGGVVNDLSSDDKHKSCGGNKYGCCVTRVGCSKAIVSGIGDALVAMMFPEKPYIGETWNNEASAPRICSIERSPANRNLDTTAAFESCVETGDIHLMGALYAAIWRDLRIAAREVSVKALRDIDTLFVKHIAELTADDTFLTVRRKILSFFS